MPRKYELRARAERQDETRLRIVDATFRLHATIGPARTTVSKIADAAGVERLTVYRHFPELADLFRACAAHGLGLHPLPEPESWRRFEQPEPRLRAALAETYAYYRAHARMVAVILRDREAGLAVGGRFLAYMETAAGVLAEAWPGGPEVRAALGHAVDFAAWRSLAIGQGLTDPQVIDLMTALVGAATRSPAS